MADIVNEQISLYGGVSQQSPILRLNSQVANSVNCYHTVEQGTRRRNPTSLISNAIGVTSNSWIYSYDRGTASSLSEKYSVVINESGIRVIDLLTGNNVPVINTSGTYLAPFSITGYSACTVKDVTFITNRNKLCTIKTKIEPNVDLSQTAFIWIKRADVIDGYNYNVTVNGSTVTTTAIKSTTAVATDLATKIDALSGVVAVSSGNIVKITGTITSVLTSDNVGDTAIGYIWKTVPTDNDLPSSMPYDAIVQIGGTDKSVPKYWLKVLDGRWVETRDPNINYELNASTMPHKLTRLFDLNGDVYFKFEPTVWDNREVGDESTSANPSFIGNSIVDIFFYRNRLGFITANNILFSEDGFYYNFFKTTQVSVLDTDRIDISVDAKKAIRLHYVEFVQDDMILFGDRTQFKISHTGILSSKTVSASIISEYDMNTKVRPLSIDDRLFFVAKNSNYSSVFAYYKDNYDEVNKADNISVHIPSYLDSDISQIVGSSVNSVVFFRSSTNKNTIYVYKYLITNKKLEQSAWSKWIFNGDIHAIFTSESKLHIILERNDSVTDDNYTLKNGVWNDEYVWEDEYPYYDSLSSSTSNLEVMNIVPDSIDSSFYDVGTVEYSSDIELSEYIPKAKDVARISDKVQLKTIAIISSDGSEFDLSITNKGNSRSVDKKYAVNRRLYIGGKPKENKVSIISDSDKGFKINGIAIEARIINRSTKI